MDQESNYDLEIRIISSNTRCRWFSFNKVVDADMTNFKDFVDEIVEKYPPRFREVVKVYYYCLVSKANIEVNKVQKFRNEKIENYVDNYFSVQKFRSTYEDIIPAIPSKEMWPKSNHGFFMHPPVLISTSGRRKNRRYKAAIEGGRGNKGRHQCPICGQYGHHWHTCKNGDPADIEAMKLERGEPKKKKKVAPTPTCATDTSIVPLTAPRMTFPPTVSTSTSAPRSNKRKRKSPYVTQSSTASIKLGAGSNQVDPISLLMLLPSPPETTTQEKALEKKKSAAGKKRTAEVKKKAATVKKKKVVEKEADKNTSSPAMGTRSKVQNSPSSPAMGTRSKRQLLV